MALKKISCYCGTFRQATRALTALYDRHLQPSGIRGTQFTILQVLAFKPGSRIRDLEDILAIDQTTLTRNLALLAKRGFVTVVERPSGREKCWGLTEPGRHTLRLAEPLWQTAQGEVRKRIGDQRAKSIHADVFDLAAQLS